MGAALLAEAALIHFDAGTFGGLAGIEFSGLGEGETSSEGDGDSKFSAENVEKGFKAGKKYASTAKKVLGVMGKVGKLFGGKKKRRKSAPSTPAPMEVSAPSRGGRGVKLAVGGFLTLAFLVGSFLVMRRRRR